MKFGLKAIEETIQRDFLKQLKELCDNYVNDMNNRIMQTINRTRTEIGFLSPLSASSRLTLTEKVTNLRNKWERKYNEETSGNSRNDNEGKDNDKINNLFEKMETLEKLLSGRGGHGGSRGTGFRGHRGAGRGYQKRFNPY